MKLHLAILGLFFIMSAANTSLGASTSDHTILNNKTEIKQILTKVANWQIANFTYSKTGSSGHQHDYGIDAWTNATLYIGMTEWARIADDRDHYYDWLNKIGNENNWAIPENFKEYPKYSLYHADELCIGQFYLNMYDRYKDEKMIRATKERVDWIISHPLDTNMNFRNKQGWTWCDALFMAPPVYAHLAELTGDNRYLRFMDEMYKRTYNHLYDKESGLFFRDDSYFGKTEANGEKIFWGRGNGWVVAGLVNILKVLPQDSAYRLYYEKLFKDVVCKLATLQDEVGFWHASLLDPTSYPTPETSATALITYSLAYGINQGLLDKEKFLSITEKAWKALVSAVNNEGKLGWVQPIGADPKKVTEDMTAVYGVGAFLLAGSQVYQLK